MWNVAGISEGSDIPPNTLIFRNIPPALSLANQRPGNLEWITLVQYSTEYTLEYSITNQ